MQPNDRDLATPKDQLPHVGALTEELATHHDERTAHVQRIHQAAPPPTAHDPSQD